MTVSGASPPRRGPRFANPWAALGGLPREVWLLCAATLVNRIGTMALVFLVLYLTERGWTARQAGLCVSVFGLGSLVASPLGGRLCDRIGARRVVLGSLGLSGLLLVAYPAFTAHAAVFAMTILWALAGEAFRPASYTLVSHAVAPSQQRAAFAALRVAINVGAAIGPAIGGLLAKISLPALFVVDGATSLVAAFVLWWGGKRRPAAVEVAASGGAPQAATHDDRKALFAEPRFVRLLVAMVLLTSVFFLVLSALPLDLVRGQGMSPAALGLLYALNAALVVVFEVPLSVHMARWPAPRALALGASCIAAGVGATAFARDFTTAVPTVVLWTIGEMLVFPAGSAYVGEITGAARRGEAMGWYTAAFAAGFIVAPLTGTWALERFGADWMWAGAAAVGALAAVLLLRLYGPDPRVVPLRAR